VSEVKMAFQMNSKPCCAPRQSHWPSLNPHEWIKLCRRPWSIL